MNTYTLSKLLFLLFLLPISLVMGQDKSAQIEACISKALSLEASSLDSAIRYITRAKTLTDEMGDRVKKVEVLSIEGGLLLKNRQFEASEHSLMEALELAKEEEAVESKIMSDILLNLGSVHLNGQNFDDALTYYLQAEPWIEVEKQPGQAVRMHNNMAIVYMRLGYKEEAKIHFESAVDTNPKEDIVTLSALANLATLYQENKNFTKALASAGAAEKIAIELGQFPIISMLYTNRSLIYQETSRLEEALEYAIKSLKIKQKYKLSGLAIAFNNIGYTHYLREEYTEAIAQYEKGLRMAVGLERLNLLRNLKQVYQAMGSLSKALDYADEYATLKDSLNTEEQKRNVAELTARYETEKKQRQIETLSFQNKQQQDKIERQYLLFGGLGMTLIMAILLFYLVYRQKRIEQQLKSTQLKQQFLRTQLNPHFLFHALNSIQDYIYEHEVEASADYLADFSKLMRYILVNADVETVSMREDADMLEKYLRLQQLNHGHHFDFSIRSDNETLGTTVLVPTLLTQPIVENALIHGLDGLKEGQLSINYEVRDDMLRITITDNGIGYFEGAKRNNTGADGLYRSKSSGIIAQRLELLGTTFRQKVQLTMKVAYPDNKERPGTQAVLELPLIVSDSYTDSSNLDPVSGDIGKRMVKPEKTV